jgi:hypothetical protein
LRIFHDLDGLLVDLILAVISSAHEIGRSLNSIVRGSSCNGTIAGVVHRYSHITPNPEHASSFLSVYQEDMAASRTIAEDARRTSACSFGVGHLRFWRDYLKRTISARFVKGGRLRGIWEALVHTTLKEWLIAFVLAVIVAMVLDLFKVAGSHLRDFGRFLKNKAAEQSVARLRSRIKELEKYKASLTLFMSSDKAHYLNAFRILLGTLLCMCAAMLLLVIEHYQALVNDRSVPNLPPPAIDLTVVMLFTFSIALIFQGLRVTSWDTRDKVAAEIKKYEREIANLTAKLNSRLGQ